MKKNLLMSLAMACMCAAMVSCDDEETYAEQKAREAKQISAYLAARNIDVISVPEFLKDTITDNPDTGPDRSRNEYVLFPESGVYMQIVQRGDGHGISSGETWLNARYLEIYVATGDTMTMNLREKSADEFCVTRTGDMFSASFISGIMPSSYGNSVPNSWIMTLPYLTPGFLNGESSAKVRIIAPHNEGTQKAANSVYPTFYEIYISTQKCQ
ncbi:MAG: DUF4827 domain-containing protein [Bacteroidaceae bacterium]|nr:DUF4827 domain-containing protein [Bacteroidaceae bacterium]